MGKTWANMFEFLEAYLTLYDGTYCAAISVADVTADPLEIESSLEVRISTALVIQQLRVGIYILRRTSFCQHICPMTWDKLKTGNYVCILDSLWITMNASILHGLI